MRFCGMQPRSKGVLKIWIFKTRLKNILIKLLLHLPGVNELTHWTLGDFNLIFKLILVNGGWSISYEIALRWMPLDLTHVKPTLVQVMAWCRQATSHYLSQCWHRSMSPNGVTRPQWVNKESLHQFEIRFCEKFMIWGKLMNSPVPSDSNLRLSVSLSSGSRTASAAWLNLGNRWPGVGAGLLLK